MPQSLLNKFAKMRPTTLLKKRLWQRRFPVCFAKFLRTSILENTFMRLLLGFISDIISGSFVFPRGGAAAYQLLKNL